MQTRTKKISLCALFSALMIAGSFIRIPTPITPITLQVQIALLAGVLLGAKWGSLSVLIYAFLGLAGLPVFAGGGGFSYVLQPTFGFVIGFALAAFVVGAVARGGAITCRRLAFALAVGLAVVYVIGLGYAALILTVYLNETVVLGEFLFAYALVALPKDLILTVVCVPLIKRLIAYTV